MKKVYLILIILIASYSFANLPPVPSGFKIINAYTNAIRLSWEKTDENKNGFIIERSDDGLSWNFTKYLPANSTSYFDVGLMKDKMYYYRISAVNREGKSEYTKIISGFTSTTEYCTIGNDSIQSPYPFYLYWTSSRTQMLYRKSEFIATSCNPYGIIGIQLHITSSPANYLNNVTVKLKNTTDTILTGFSDSSWTTLFSSYINITQNSWLTIYFTNWFSFDQNKNLLVEICLTNAVYYPTNAFTRSSSAPGRTWHAHQDYVNGCTLTGGSVQVYRPNMHFITFINTVIKINELINPEYRLEQNYPNPFNSSTKFRFRIKKSGPVTLSVYDILGRQEILVFSEPLEPGEYEKIFSIDKYPLPSGIYYYCLSTPDYSEVKKMVIIK